MTIAIGQLAPIALSVCVCIYMDVRPLHVSCRCRWLVNCARSESPAAAAAARSPVCLLYSRLEGGDCSSVSTSTGAAKQTHPPRPLCVVFHAAAEIRDNPALL